MVPSIYPSGRGGAGLSVSARLLRYLMWLGTESDEISLDLR